MANQTQRRHRQNVGLVSSKQKELSKEQGNPTTFGFCASVRKKEFSQTAIAICKVPGLII